MRCALLPQPGQRPLRSTRRLYRTPNAARAAFIGVIGNDHEKRHEDTFRPLSGVAFSRRSTVGAKGFRGFHTLAEAEIVIRQNLAVKAMTRFTLPAQNNFSCLACRFWGLTRQSSI